MTFGLHLWCLDNWNIHNCRHVVNIKLMKRYLEMWTGLFRLDLHIEANLDIIHELLIDLNELLLPADPFTPVLAQFCRHATSQLLCTPTQSVRPLYANRLKYRMTVRMHVQEQSLRVDSHPRTALTLILLSFHEWLLIWNHISAVIQRW